MTRTQIVGAVAFVTLAVALVLGVSVLGVDDKNTPLITSVLGFIGLAIGQVMATAKSEATERKVTELSADLRNGTFERLVREALQKIADDDSTNLVIHRTNGREDESQ